MSDLVCRLCLNSNNIVDLFHPDLANSEYLRSSILLATGINISPGDEVTKHVCASCCEMTVRLCRFRKTALANDNALNLEHGHTPFEFPLKVEDIVNMNSSIVAKLFLKPEPPSKPRNAYTVHPSVVQLFKNNQNLIIPNELLTVNLDPTVYVKPWTGNDLPEEVVVDENDPIVFQLTCPDIDIVEVPESRKRPSLETDNVEAKRAKVDDLMVTHRQNISVQPDSKVSYKIVKSKSGKENLGGTNKIVLARVSSKESINYIPDSGPSASSRGDLNTTMSPNRKTLRSRKARPSFFLRDYEVDLDNSDFLLETVEEEDAYNCELCNKFFDHKLKLKAHIRYHKKCLGCNAIFRSYKALSYHQTNVCFKQIVVRQPTLCLPRCDDSEEIKSIKLGIPTIELPFGNDNDEVLIISDDEESTTKEIDRTDETYIQSIFNKYKKLRSPVPSINYQHENTGTDSLLDATITTNTTDNKTEVVVEGMYPFLQSLRVPIEQDRTIQPDMAARLQPTQIQRTVQTMETWSGTIKELSKKPLILDGQQGALPIAVPKFSSSKNPPANLQTGQSVSQIVPQPDFVPPMQPNNAGQKTPQAESMLQMAGQPIAQNPIQSIAQNHVSNEKQISTVRGYLRVKAAWELM